MHPFVFTAPKKLDMPCPLIILGKSKLLEGIGLFNHWLKEDISLPFSFPFFEYKIFLGIPDAA